MMERDESKKQKMDDGKENAEQKKKAEEFERKYERLLNELKVLPRTDLSEKEQRYQWFRVQPEHDGFITDLMYAYNSPSYMKLMKRLTENSEKKAYLESNADWDIISPKGRRKDIDPVIFMEAIKEAVEDYSGKNKSGEHYDFVACVGQKYRQRAKKALDKETGTPKGMVSGRSGRSQEQVGKLLKAVYALKECQQDGRSLEELIQFAIGQSKVIYSKNDVEDVLAILKYLNFVELDRSLDNDSDTTYEEFFSVEEKGYQRVEMVEEKADFLSFFSQLAENIENNWNFILSVVGKINRDILKAFLTKDILIELKLRELPQEELKRLGKNDNDIKAEPKCAQWCSQAKRCKRREKGCRVRYDLLKKNPPYGNDGIYQLLKPCGRELYGKILHKAYLNAALPNSSFEDVYQNRLYPNPTAEKQMQDDDAYFDFSNQTLGMVLGKDKSQISRYRKKYETEAKLGLSKMFYKMFGK